MDATLSRRTVGLSFPAGVPTLSEDGERRVR